MEPTRSGGADSSTEHEVFCWRSFASVESPDELALVARSSVLVTFLVAVMKYLKRI